MVGYVVNVTRRILQWTGTGEIFMTRITFEALEKPLEADRLEPARVKGRTQPVEAYRIAGQDPVA